VYRIGFPLQYLESFPPGSAVLLSVLLQPSFFLPAPTEERPWLSTLLLRDARSSLFQFSEDGLLAVRDDHVFLAIYDANIAILINAADILRINLSVLKSGFSSVSLSAGTCKTPPDLHAYFTSLAVQGPALSYNILFSHSNSSFHKLNCFRMFVHNLIQHLLPSNLTIVPSL
jgi:hypothetical protein